MTVLTMKGFRYLCYQRSAFAIGCSIVVQYIMIAIFSFIAEYFRTGVFCEKPNLIIKQSQRSHSKAWWTVILPLICVVHGVYITSTFIAPSKCSSKFVFHCEKLLKNLGEFGFYALIGILTENSYYHILGGDFINVAGNCDEFYFINQYYPYLCLHGAFPLIIVHLKEHINLDFQWKVPVIHQCKKVQFTSKMSEILWKSVLGSGLSTIVYMGLYLAHLRTGVLSTSWRTMSLLVQRLIIYSCITSFQTLVVAYHIRFLVPLFVAERVENMLEHNFPGKINLNERHRESMLAERFIWLDVFSTTNLDYTANIKLMYTQCCSIISCFTEFVHCSLYGPTSTPKSLTTFGNSAAVKSREQLETANCLKSSLGQILTSSFLRGQKEIRCIGSQNQHIINIIRMASFLIAPVARKAHPSVPLEPSTDIVASLLKLRDKLDQASNIAINGNDNEKVYLVRKVVNRSLYRLITGVEVSLVENVDKYEIECFINYMQ